MDIGGFERRVEIFNLEVKKIWIVFFLEVFFKLLEVIFFFFGRRIFYKFFLYF